MKNIKIMKQENFRREQKRNTNKLLVKNSGVWQAQVGPLNVNMF